MEILWLDSELRNMFIGSMALAIVIFIPIFLLGYDIGKK